jgi:enoyl-CoA hydratase/carnithine racemase
MLAARRTLPVLQQQFARTSVRNNSNLVTCEIVGNGVAKVTLNDPLRLNALTVQMGEAFVSVMEEVFIEQKVKV